MAEAKRGGKKRLRDLPQGDLSIVLSNLSKAQEGRFRSDLDWQREYGRLAKRLKTAEQRYQEAKHEFEVHLQVPDYDDVLLEPLTKLLDDPTDGANTAAMLQRIAWDRLEDALDGKNLSDEDKRLMGQILRIVDRRGYASSPELQKTLQSQLSAVIFGDEFRLLANVIGDFADLGWDLLDDIPKTGRDAFADIVYTQMEMPQPILSESRFLSGEEQKVIEESILPRVESDLNALLFASDKLVSMFPPVYTAWATQWTETYRPRPGASPVSGALPSLAYSPPSQETKMKTEPQFQVKTEPGLPETKTSQLSFIEKGSVFRTPRGEEYRVTGPGSQLNTWIAAPTSELGEDITLIWNPDRKQWVNSATGELLLLVMSEEDYYF